MSIAIDINGECVTMRDVRRTERTAIFAEAWPLLAELRESFFLHNCPPPVPFVLALTERHPEAWAALLARATGRDREWLAELSEADATRLALAFLAAGRRFWRAVGSVDLQRYLIQRRHPGSIEA